MRNGSFTQEALHWGTGYYEDLLRNGNEDDVRRRAAKYWPYVTPALHVIWTPQGPCRPLGPCPEVRTLDLFPDGSAGLDGRRFRSAPASFRIHYDSPYQEGQWGALSQRLSGLGPHRWYEATAFIYSEFYTPGALMLATNNT